MRVSHSHQNGLRLGIDTGGTYTDAALVNSADQVVAFGKALTTQYNLAIGIENVLTQLPDSLLNEVSLVSLSTTLATNAVVEGRGTPVGLILAGYNRRQIERGNIETIIRGGQFALLDGSHDASGNEAMPVDLESAEKILLRWKGRISAIGISGIFSVRNPTHEIALRKLAEKCTGLPITCGHELASLLDAPRRAVTVAINASLIPFISELIHSLQTIIKARNISAPLMMVKGDGSLVKAEVALQRPVETVISGPAASVVGAHHLSKSPNAIVADMGGTTTDISILNRGRLNISQKETVIGDWRPMIETIKLVSIGLGGDSEARYQGGHGLALGPRRVVPMSLLAYHYPQVLELLNAQLSNTPTSRSNRFALPLHASTTQLELFSKTELEVWEMLKEGPLEMEALTLKFRQHAKAVATLMRRGAVIYSGVTPSDAAHVLQYTNHWSRDAAKLSVNLWIKQMRHVYGWQKCTPSDTQRASELIHKEAIRRITEAIIQSALTIDNRKHKSFRTRNISEMIADLVIEQQERGTQLFSINFVKNIKLVAVGAPAHIYYQEVSKNLGIPVDIPPNAQVANAVGAVVGSVVQRTSTTITQPEQGLYRVHDTNGLIDFYNVEEAIACAKVKTEKQAIFKAQQAGGSNIELSTEEEHTSVDCDESTQAIFFESVITATATGRPAFR